MLINKALEVRTKQPCVRLNFRGIFRGTFCTCNVQTLCFTRVYYPSGSLIPWHAITRLFLRVLIHRSAPDPERRFITYIL